MPPPVLRRPPPPPLPCLATYHTPDPPKNRVRENSAEQPQPGGHHREELREHLRVRPFHRDGPQAGRHGGPHPRRREVRPGERLPLLHVRAVVGQEVPPRGGAEPRPNGADPQQRGLPDRQGQSVAAQFFVLVVVNNSRRSFSFFWL